jgi:hypothetical protein
MADHKSKPATLLVVVALAAVGAAVFLLATATSMAALDSRVSLIEPLPLAQRHLGEMFSIATAARPYTKIVR